MHLHCLQAATFKADFPKTFFCSLNIHHPSHDLAQGAANLPRAAHNKEPMQVRQSTSASVASK